MPLLASVKARKVRQRSISQTKNAKRLTVSDPWNLKKIVSRLGKVMPVKPAWLMAFIMVAVERRRGDREFREILKGDSAEGVKTDCRKARHIGWVLRRSTPVALRRGKEDQDSPPTNGRGRTEAHLMDSLCSLLHVGEAADCDGGIKERGESKGRLSDDSESALRANEAGKKKGIR